MRDDLSVWLKRRRQWDDLGRAGKLRDLSTLRVTVRTLQPQHQASHSAVVPRHVFCHNCARVTCVRKCVPGMSWG